MSSPVNKLVLIGVIFENEKKFEFTNADMNVSRNNELNFS